MFIAAHLSASMLQTNLLREKEWKFTCAKTYLSAGDKLSLYSMYLSSIVSGIMIQYIDNIFQTNMERVQGVLSPKIATTQPKS